eukprot:9922365-Ditylum_brightwellii.AAC.1
MEATLKVCHQLLDYCTMYPNATLCYLTSVMILAAYSDVPYLSKKNSRSRAAGNFFLNKGNNAVFNNGAILTMSTVMQYVVNLASEA